MPTLLSTLQIISPTLAATDVLSIVLVFSALVAGLVIGIVGSKFVIGSTIARARAEASEIVRRAESDAATAAEKIQLESERRALERKEAFEVEMEKTRHEVRDMERRAEKRQDALDRRDEAISQKEQTVQRSQERLAGREQQLTAKEQTIEGLIEEQRSKLLQVSGMSVEEARREVLTRVEEESRHEAAKVARQITERAEEDAKNRAREVTLQAIQRYTADHVAEATVRSVAIPSDDMKGRIIGREGRNIRAIEKATGADIIVDDTPGVIVVSCFDKVRQAVAVESLERLIADGRMHPGRIEEVVEKVRKEIDEKVLESGKQAAVEANVRGLHPKIIEAMGKLHFRTSYSQNVLRHSIEVAYFAQIIADQLGLDGNVARRCGFLHDIGKAMDHEMEGGHPKIGMEFARQYNEKDPVLNVIGGHHGDIPSTSFYTPIVMAADAISGARPGARRESMERYIQRLEELQNIALSFKGVTEAHAVQAGREVRVMVDAKRVNDDEAHWIATEIAKRVGAEMTFPGEIRVTVLRETRAVEIAR